MKLIKGQTIKTNIPKHKISRALLYVVSISLVFGFINLINGHLGYYLLSTGIAAFAYLMSVNFIFHSRAKKNVQAYRAFLIILVVLIIVGIGVFT